MYAYRRLKITVMISILRVSICHNACNAKQIPNPISQIIIHSRKQRSNKMAFQQMSSFSGEGKFKIIPKKYHTKKVQNRCFHSSPKCSRFHRTTLTMMPEGPEVRTLVDQLQSGVGMRLIKIEFLSGRYINHGTPVGYTKFMDTMTAIPNLSSSDITVDVLKECDVVTEWNAKGKFIYLTLDDGNPRKSSIVKNDTKNNSSKDDYKRSIWITLGMTGRFINDHQSNAEENARWVFHFLHPTSQTIRKIYYHDTRNFGTLKFSLSSKELEKKLLTLGYDILDSETTFDTFMETVNKQRNPNKNICVFLMDQKGICGIGNYILAEALYRAHLDPFACLNEFNNDQWISLYTEIRETALESYNAQGMTRSKGGSYRNMNGEKGQYTFDLQCYGREICAKGKPVIREVNGPHKRTIWYVHDQLFVPRNQRDNNGMVMDHDDTQFLDGNDIEMGTIATKAPSNDGLTFLLHDDKLDISWKDNLAHQLSSEKYIQLSNFLSMEKAKGYTIYPPKNDIFSALHFCPLNEVKVVIVGQDPYHGAGQGHGLAFSVRMGVQPPPSLKNIFKELNNDLGMIPPKHGNLESWAKQGVLLLNSVLTVRHGEANSHANQGWEDFTDEIISIVNEQNEHVVFLLWGGPAAKKAQNVDDSKHTIIKCSHPSPLAASRTKSPFLGSNCFSRANTALEQFHQTPIDWMLP